MIDNAIAIYCFLHNRLKAMNHYEDAQVRMSDAEVMLACLLAGLYFSGTYTHALEFLKSNGLCLYVLSKSQYSRRLNRVKFLLDDILQTVASVQKTLNDSGEYVADSYPVALCHNMRAPNNRLLPYDKEYVGMCVTKRGYFYGFRVQMIATADGRPVEYAIVPGSWADPHGMQALPLDLPAASRVMFDAGYTSYETEDVAADAGLWFDIARKSNSKRLEPAYRTFYKSVRRKRIETVFSTLTRRMGRTIHATNLSSFLLKVSLFIWCEIIVAIL